MTNSITITGHLGQDAELRYTPSGVACLSFSVGDDERKKNQAGDWEKVGTTWWRCQIWRDKAEAAAPVLVKGAKVIVTGRAKLRRYETRDGGNGQSLDIDAYDVAVVPKNEPRQAQAPAGDPWGGASDVASDEPPF